MTTSKTVALITGANKGIGFEIARQLGKKGLLVVLGARDEAKVPGSEILTPLASPP